MRGMSTALLVLGCTAALAAAVLRPRVAELRACDNFGTPRVTTGDDGEPSIDTYVEGGKAVLRDQWGNLGKHRLSKARERVLRGEYHPVTYGEAMCLDQRRDVLAAALFCVRGYCVVRS